ncbi:MAG: hypothetical protein J6S87_10480, partial [Bacteroidales bacterium]|nr:hypothetical protein [Bacteroidales bacterium]
CKIEVRHGSDIIRRYLFYTENSRASQFKTRLTDVIRVDTAEAEPWCGISMSELEEKLRFKGTRTNFEYYDAPDPENIFGEEKTYALPSDGVQATYISQGFNGQEGMATALGGTKGKSWSLGGTASVGVGFNVCMTTVSVGGNFDYSRSQSEGALTLIDLDGDGLADKVFKDGKKIYYRKRLPYADSLAFSEKREIAGLEDFLQETSSTTTWGLQASAGCSFSGSWPTTKSSTNTYFADVNADGLPDLITEDGVLFNTTQRGGNVTFTSYYRILESQPEPNDSLPIVINSSLPCEDFIFDGAVNDSIACGIEWELVRNYFFKSGDTSEYRAFTSVLDSLFGTGEYTARYEYEPVDSAIFDPAMIHPNKVELYHKTVVCEPQPLDPDMDAVKVWVAQKTGRIEIASTIRLLPDTTESRRQSKLVDGVRYTIQYDSLPHLANDTLRCDTSREIFSQVIGEDDTLPHSHTDTVSVTEGDFIFFRLQSQGSRAFDLVDWQREIRYINTTAVTDQYGLNDNLYSSSGDFTVSGPHYFQAHKNGTRADIDVYIKTGNIGTSAMLWVLYPIAGSYTTLPFPIVSNQDQQIPLITSFPDRSDSIRFYVVSNGGTNWGAVEIRPHIRYRYVESANNPDTIDYYPPVEFPYNNYKQTSLDSLEHNLFGPLYRGWGQFAYNNNADDNSAITDLIDISTLFVEPIRVSGNQADTLSIYNVPSMGNNSTQEDVTASYDSQGMYHPLSKNTRWVEMQPESRYWSWVGFGNINYMMRDTVSNTRLPGLVCDTATSDIPEYDHPVPQPTTLADSVEISPKTVRKQNVSKLRNYSLSIGVPVVPISTGASWSNGDNRILTDYMDLNGDRYPDVVGEVNVQYTMPWGGIGHLQPLTQHVTGVTSSATSSTGTTYGASYSIPTRGASNTPRNSKISFDGQGLSASLGGGSDCTSYTFMDVNGDGLPDKVTADGLVALNTGYSFLPYENWNSGGI